MEYDFLLIIAIILLSTKFFGLVSEKVHMPQVVGALLAGIILGPSVLGVLTETHFVVQTAEIGVILLMFLAGLDTDLEEVKKTGIASVIIAIIEIIVSLAGGAIVYYLFYKDNANVDPMFMLKSVFMGVIITSTSVTIAIEALREMGKLKGKMGTTILGAAIIDDIIGIIILTVIISITDTNVKPSSVFIKILLFFIFIGVLYWVTHKLKGAIEKQDGKRRSSIYSLASCFILAYISEKFFGIADLTGAYFAGIILCNIGVRDYIARKVTILSYLIFSPIFFASIGIKTNIQGITVGIILFALVLLVVSILTKIVGCFIGAKLCKFSSFTALAIGTGMVARGEVSLIVAQKGAKAGLLDETLFPAVVIVVILTTLLTPIMLKLVLSNKRAVGQIE
ncbi:cation:proton antiporter [uncultured Tyzzerella sp.]|uniref:cation:proton antiporter n=1 Tax=uncultured Tyzzerella sp. TaxID=2321398 RepID=UPI002942CAFC|nr:cation:proton antiporter [uncultured Tyzzerella sp.]